MEVGGELGPFSPSDPGLHAKLRSLGGDPLKPFLKSWGLLELGRSMGASNILSRVEVAGTTGGRAKEDLVLEDPGEEGFELGLAVGEGRELGNKLLILNLLAIGGV